MGTWTKVLRNSANPSHCLKVKGMLSCVFNDALQISQMELCFDQNLIIVFWKEIMHMNGSVVPVNSWSQPVFAREEKRRKKLADITDELTLTKKNIQEISSTNEPLLLTQKNISAYLGNLAVLDNNQKRKFFEVSCKDLGASFKINSSDSDEVAASSMSSSVAESAFLSQHDRNSVHSLDSIGSQDLYPDSPDCEDSSCTESFCWDDDSNMLDGQDLTY